jgi:asparagine N-glycosylation enzyme membrane subunit Stt3
MQVTYQLTDEDYRQGLQLIRQPAWLRLGFYIVTGFYVLALLLWLAFRIKDPNGNAVKNLQPLVILFAAWIAIFGLRPYMTRRAIRKQLQNTPSAGVPTTLTISETGLHFHSAYADATTSWSSYVKWAEGKTVFALFTGPKFVTIVPKGVFADGDIERFRELVSRSIPLRQGR